MRKKINNQIKWKRKFRKQEKINKTAKKQTTS